MLRFAVLAVFVLGAVAQWEELPAGTREMVEEWTVPPGEEDTLESVNYPEDAGVNLRQTWRVVTEEGSTVSLQCQDLRTVETPRCKEAGLVLTDGSGKQQVCGPQENFSYVSTGPSLSVKLRTGESGQGFVKCTVKASPTPA